MKSKHKITDVDFYRELNTTLNMCVDYRVTKTVGFKQAYRIGKHRVDAINISISHDKESDTIDFGFIARISNSSDKILCEIIFDYEHTLKNPTIRVFFMNHGDTYYSYLIKDKQFIGDVFVATIKHVKSILQEKYER